MNRGYSLLEVLVVLSLVGAGASLLAERLRHFGDGIAARAVREEIVGLVSTARARGRASGGAELLLHEDGRYVIRSGRDHDRFGVISRSPGVALTLSGGRDSVVVRFDRLGLGRMASTTISVRAGTIERAVVLSAYGRLRRR